MAWEDSLPMQMDPVVINGIRKRRGVTFSCVPAQLREEMRESNARQLLPEQSAAVVRRTCRAVAPELARSVYENPSALRRLAERVRDGALGTAASWVYFIEAMGTDAIKIGVSVNPEKRLVSIQGHCPGELRLLGAVNGDTTLERFLHGVFAADRMRGEWFRRSPTLLEFIRVVMLRARPRA